MDAFLRNLRFAVRTLARTPGFTATVVLMLALGVGANSAVFSAIDAVLLRPLPFPESAQLVEVAQKSPRISSPFVAPVRLMDWARMNAVFQSVTGSYTEDVSETTADLPERLHRAWVAPRFVETLGLAPILGRGFRAQEEHFGAPEVALISQRFWMRRFHGDPHVTEKQLRIDGRPYAITGVMPPVLRVPDPDVDLWSPVPMDAPYAQERLATWFGVIARMKPGVTVAQARENMAAVQAELGRTFPATDRELAVNVRLLKDATVGGSSRSLWILFGSVSLLLLIACANIAALLLSRGTQRTQEIAIRRSLGATRASLAAQMITEAFALAIAGSLLGLAVAAAASGAFRAVGNSIPRAEEIHLNWSIVAYTLACGCLVTLLCGVLPALRGSRDPALARAGRSLVSFKNPLQWMLVGVQVALSVILLAGAGLLLRSFQELGRVSPGFNPRNMLTLRVSSNWGETGDLPGMRRWTMRLLDELAAVPGVRQAALATSVPGVPSNFQVRVQVVEGRAPTDPPVLADAQAVSPTYFATMQIPLLSGETCRESGPPGMLVNRSFADTYLDGRVAGKHLVVGPGGRPVEIRGVVSDTREHGLDKTPQPAIYFCNFIAQPGSVFLVRTQGEPLAMGETLRRKVHEIEPTRSVFEVMPLEDHLSDANSENRLRTILLACFAATAMGLASVGLYGTLSYLVNTRRREVGLRLALGAKREQIAAHFLGHGLRVTVPATAAGLALSLGAAPSLARLLYGVSPMDPRTLAAVTLAVISVGAVASLLPAVRAARTEPARVLREE